MLQPSSSIQYATSLILSQIIFYNNTLPVWEATVTMVAVLFTGRHVKYNLILIHHKHRQRRDVWARDRSWKPS